MRALLLAALLPLLLARCAEPPPVTTVRVCDSTGCRDQERGEFRRLEPNDLETTPIDPRLASLEGRAAAGDAGAAYDLGLAYLTGDGAPQQGGLAMRWLRVAAEGGEAEAQLALGRLYLSGYETVGQDVTEADRWLRAAAASGHGPIADEARKLLIEVEQARAKDGDLAASLAEHRPETEIWVRGRARARGPYSYPTGYDGFYDPYGSAGSRPARRR